MKLGTGREAHKLQTLINTNSDILIIIDHHLDQQKLASLVKNNSQILLELQKISKTRESGDEIFILSH